MSNLKKRKFFNAITGNDDDGKFYGRHAEIYRKSDNIDMIFDSRGEYLGLRMSMGKIVKERLTFSNGPFYYESFDELKIWAGVRCADYIVKGNKIIALGELGNK